MIRERLKAAMTMTRTPQRRHRDSVVQSTGIDEYVDVDTARSRSANRKPVFHNVKTGGLCMIIVDCGMPIVSSLFPYKRAKGDRLVLLEKLQSRVV